MSQIVPVTNIPNQELSFSSDGNQYDIRIHACQDTGIPGVEIMAVDITINNVVIVTGIRAVPEFPIIPAEYLENGNFFISTLNDDYPDWRQFGFTQFLIYVSEAELISLRAAS